VTNSRRLIAAPRGLPSRESYLVLSTVTRKFGLNTALWMSALGQKQTCAAQNGMSALPPKADMCDATRYVRFGSLADISQRNRYVRSTPEKRTLLIACRGKTG
jgi:hypothetical protein